MSRSRLLVAFTGALAALVLFILPLLASPANPSPFQCDPVASPCQRVTNGLVRADVGPSGSWVMGTTGGDPSTALDDDKTLIYGFRPGGVSVVGSGFTTVRILSPNGPVDIVPSFAAAQTSGADRVDTVWLLRTPFALRITETLRLRPNPFSGRLDAVSLCYDTQNEDSAPLTVGLRALLDVKLGQNDGAPYFVPGLGAVTTESEFLGAAVPSFWIAFESKTYDPRMLRSVGILRADGYDPPDRFVIADWVGIQNTDWDYPIAATQAVTNDSAVALYWNPRPIATRAHAIYCSGYGVAGNGGGSAFISAPLQAKCGDTFQAAVFVNNFETVPLTGGRATIGLSPGLALASGEMATKPMAPIPPGGTGSVVWQLRVIATGPGDEQLTTTASFDGGRVFQADSTLTVSCPLPTPTPTVPTPTPRPSPTIAPTPTTGPAPGPTPGVCTFILNRVPPAAINWALANPTRVYGWGLLANPSAPPSPFNQLRTQLSLQNIAAPYHPLGNALVYKAGCP